MSERNKVMLVTSYFSALIKEATMLFEYETYSQ